MRLCLDWRVVGGLAVVGVALWVAAPGPAGAALPLLIVLACPLSMVIIMRGMSGGRCAAEPARAGADSGVPQSREQQLARLEDQLAVLRARQETLAREIAALETDEAPAPREAEIVAPAAGPARPEQT